MHIPLTIQPVLATITQELPTQLGDTLVGIYLYGSAVWGDFDDDISDIDLLVVLTRDIDDALFALLDTWHQDLEARFPAWAGRIEIAYISTTALQTFRSHNSPIAVISPGEPFNIKEAGIDWLINWYTIRHQSVVLSGPVVATVIPDISAHEFRDNVRRQVGEWRDWVSHSRDSRPSQSYTILTMCRALYAWDSGTQVSKRVAAEWAMQQLPDHAGIIANALVWRRDHRELDINHAATYRFAVEMVRVVGEKIGIAWE
jgi:predicted nucleotidyltransferase